MTVHGIDLDTQAIRSFCKKWKIKELSVFGSILRQDFRPDSDIDFLVTFDGNAQWDLYDVELMRDELERTIGRSVDVISRSAIERSDNRFIKKEVLSTAETVYAKR
jgi:predicted nucleotidyltransferase